MDIPGLVSKYAERSPARLIDEMSRLFWLSRAIHVVAELGVADHLDKTPLTADALAAKTGSNADALAQLLQFLSAYGVFAQTPDGKFDHNELSVVLREDHPDSQKSALRRYRQYWWAAVGELEHSIRTGESAFEKVHGSTIFEFIHDDPEMQARFDAAMAQISNADDAAIAAAYDFRKFNRIVDVGGGRGGLLTQILLAAPTATGVLFDQPQVVERATRLEQAGLSGRYERRGGNFFAAVPEGGDCYVIKGVLHDFNDEQCITILSNCRKVMPDDGHLIIVNHDLPASIDGPHPNLTMDIQMMAVLNGRERSQPEWADLVQRSGFRIISANQPDVLFTLIDCVPV